MALLYKGENFTTEHTEKKSNFLLGALGVLGGEIFDLGNRTSNHHRWI
jgi:hypothetical protein